MKKYLLYIIILLFSGYGSAQSIDYNFSPFNNAECSYINNVTNGISNNFTQTQQVLRPIINDTTSTAPVAIPTTLPPQYGVFDLEQSYITETNMYYYTIYPPYSKIAIIDSFFVKILSDEDENDDSNYVKDRALIVNLVNDNYPYVIIRNLTAFNNEIELRLYNVNGLLLYSSLDYKNNCSMANLRKGTYFYLLKTVINGKKIKQKGFIEKI